MDNDEPRMSEFKRAEGRFDGFIDKINVGYDETVTFMKKVKDEISPRGEIMDKIEGNIMKMKTILVKDTQSS